MSDAERFDAFYADSRDRLLVLAFALTGDLPASRGAVRDSFIASWHHWGKIKRLEDPGTWVRPHVWTHAQRRHTARIWHRDRKLDPELRATLEALAKLSVVPRKALLLTELTSASRAETAHELGLPLEVAEKRIVEATAQFARHREVAAAEVRPLLEQLTAHCAGQRWPRATIIRRAGTARRRTYALTGSALVVATLVVSGFAVADHHGVHPTLAAAGDRLQSVPAEGTGETGDQSGSPQITPASLISVSQLGRAVHGRTWRVTGTDPKQGTTFPCQRRAYADPRASTALVRNFTARHEQGKPRLAVVEAMELSATEQAAKVGYATANRWFAACSMPQMQLVGVRRIQHLGDDAQQYVLRSWSRPASTYVLGVARTGRITTLTLTRTSGTAGPDLAGNVRLLVSAVDDLCSSTMGGRCSAMPRAVDIPAPRAGALPMMLSEFDLPPVAGVTQPWVGTTPRRALQNVAATGCDRSSFHGGHWQRAATRSFLVPDGHLAAPFGITETVGRLPEPAAKSFVEGVRAKLGSCSDRELGTKALRLAGGPTWTAWRVRTEVTDKETVTFFMGIVRSGGAIAQVGFVPDGIHTMTTAQFVALLRRAGERLTAMPAQPNGR
jgi:DNA-directed RNA polymerase specialized sigma24 family protein